MKFIQGNDRRQTHLFPVSLDESIDQDNQVRLIDIYVESLPLDEFGFRTDFVDNGRPAYHPLDLLKLYIYGYWNKIRSSRDLEKECQRNIEVMWLLKCLQPDHNTISNFRRDNPKAIKKVFRATVQIAKHFNLIGGKLIAGDSTKFRAQNSKKNNFDQRKINRHIAYIDNKLDQYNKQLAEQDGDAKEQIKEEIDKHQRRKDNYHDLENQLRESGDNQISTSDPESRKMFTRNNTTEVAYNVQTTVDAKYNLPIDYKVTNTGDIKAMGNMLQRAKSILRKNDFIALYDKGYHAGSELWIAEQIGIQTLVATRCIASSSQAPDPKYNVENFEYSHENDTYTCPMQQTLKSNGRWYKGTYFNFKLYKTSACKNCDVRKQCTSSQRERKTIQRSEFASAIERNKERIEQSAQFYRRRQSIVEHPYGTIKRQWGFSYIITKTGKQRASADVGLMFTVYLLKRMINILGKDVFKKYLKSLAGSFLLFWSKFRAILRHFKESNLIDNIDLSFYGYFLKQLIFTPKLVANESY